VKKFLFHHTRLFLCLLLFIFLENVSAQDNRNNRLFLDVPPDTFITKIDSLIDTLALPDAFIIPRSERIFRNEFRLLRNIHYFMEENQGRVIFRSTLKPGDSLTVIYQKYPFPLIPEYRHRELQTMNKKNTAGDSTKYAYGVVRKKLFDDLDSFSSNLQRSGSIVRGIEIGNNRDLTLNSGLNLQLSGYITPEVELVAALTDESTPLQPEGNTQTLREVDKVFVKINSPRLGGTLGDFKLTYQNSLFGNLQRKLQGITAHGEFGNFHQQITYATSRGTFYTNQFLGQEGNQGPYQLLGKNGEREIIVLAGTERVYVNGILQKRGENNDYIIDYSLGQLTFTNNRLITSEDRIEVDFEYANNFQRYGKNFVGFSASKREWDDTKNLLEDSAPLSETEKSALASAGDDPFQAAVSGAEFLGVGKGNYVLRDTIVAGKNTKYFQYVGSGKGDYLVRFTSVGPGRGSYIRERLGIYRFVGDGRGMYLPIRLVPLAGDKKFGDVNFSYLLRNNFAVEGEMALSSFDKNVFSAVNDEDNLGKAFSLGVSYQNESLHLLKKNMGQLNWRLNWNRRDRHFSPLDRPFDPEYNYKWNLAERVFETEEDMLETTLNYRPGRNIFFSMDGGWIKRGTAISSRRGKMQLVLADSTVLKSEIFGEWIKSNNIQISSNWLRYGGSLGRKLWQTMPAVNFRLEDRQVLTENNRMTGFRFAEAAVGIKFFKILGMRWHFQNRWRRDFLYNPHIEKNRLELSNSLTSQLRAWILQSQKWQGRVSFVYREKNFSPFFEQLPPDSMAMYQPDPQFQDTTWQDRQSHLANLEVQYRNKNRTIDSRLDYKVASELQAMQEKVFLKVEENRGNYRFDDELQEYVPDPLGDYLLIIVPTGRFESVTNIEAGWQLRYRPKPVRQKLKGIQKVLKNISTFTYLKVNEKSREKDIWQLYLLNFQKYHNLNTTVRGTYWINQDIYFFERNPDFGITLRSRYRDNLYNQYVDARFNESRRLWDRSIIWRQKIWGRVLSHEMEYKQSTNFRFVQAAPSRNRDVFGQSLKWKLNYRPVYAWQIRLQMEAGLQKDRAKVNQLQVRYLEVAPQINYAVRGKARAVVSLNYLNVRILQNPFNRPLPFEMGKGKREGHSFNWNIRFEYFVSSNITVTVNYNGRRDAGMSRTIHLGQAEVRAFF